MSKQRLDLLAASAGRKSEVSARQAALELLAGRQDLREALGVDPEVIEGLREQAVQLYEAGQHGRCRDVLVGIAELGAAQPIDVLLLAAACRLLGEHAQAARLADLGEALAGEAEARRRCPA